MGDILNNQNIQDGQGVVPADMPMEFKSRILMNKERI